MVNTTKKIVKMEKTPAINQNKSKFERFHGKKPEFDLKRVVKLVHKDDVQKLASKLEAAVLRDKTLTKSAENYHDWMYPCLTMMNLPTGSTLVKLIKNKRNENNIAVLQVKEDTVALFVMDPKNLVANKYIVGQLGAGKTFYAAIAASSLRIYQHDNISRNIAIALGFCTPIIGQVRGKRETIMFPTVKSEKTNMELEQYGGKIKGRYEGKGSKDTVWVYGGGKVELTSGGMIVGEKSTAYGEGPHQKAKKAFEQLLKVNREAIAEECRKHRFKDLAAVLEDT